MSAIAPFDPRSVANLLLDTAEGRSKPLTNLALQKLLYFAHALFLIEAKKPLVLGYFEAWQYGPVHPTVYKAFKVAGDQPIDFRAVKTDLVTGKTIAVAPAESRHVQDLVSRIIDSYGRMTPGRLVEISHAKNGPWDYVVGQGNVSLAFGMKIPDNVIVERFKYHKVPIALTPLSGEPSEDTPFA